MFNKKGKSLNSKLLYPILDIFAGRESVKIFRGECSALSFSWDILIITWIIYNMRHASFWDLKDGAEIQLPSRWERFCDFVSYL